MSQSYPLTELKRDLSKYSVDHFDRGAPGWKEWAWWICRTVFFMHSFPLPSALKTILLKCFGARLGQKVVIRSNVNITFPWRLTLGDHVWLGDDVVILSLADVEIESNVCISQRAFLCTGNHDYKKDTFDLFVEPIKIEEGCWVGAMAFVGPGVHLKKNTICVAGTVVVKGGGPNEVIAGNPGKVVRKLETGGSGSEA